MKALGVFLLIECCLFAAYLAHRTPATRFHSRILLAAMLSILVIALDYDQLSFSFMLWTVLTICWTAGVLLAASEMLGWVVNRPIQDRSAGVNSYNPLSRHEKAIERSRKQLLAP
jgi:hypothetical protein